MRLPYYRAMYRAIRANMQNGRAGAGTTYFNCFDPEIKDLLVLKNQKTVVDKQIRGIDYAMLQNKFFAKKVAKNENIFTFNVHTAPDLSEALYSGDVSYFEDLYQKYENNPDFKKNYIPARDIVLTSLNEAFETGRAYLGFIDEINRHTPFKDKIYSSNLCLEICQPTAGYHSMPELYTDGPVGFVELETEDDVVYSFKAVDKIELIDHPDWKVCSAQNLEVGWSFCLDREVHRIKRIIEVQREPEVSLCTLGAIIPTFIENDQEYEEAMYFTLLMGDKCIHKAEYVLPHVGYCAQQRLSVGIGLMDVAHYLARKGLNYTSLEGKKEIHRLAERHSYFAIKASLQLAKELGNCPWGHRTKWADGWLPIDTANKAIDQIVDEPLHYDWEALRAEIIANGGIRHSDLIAHMPGESSSKASGVTNSLYPVRELTLVKTDNGLAIHWAAPDGDILSQHYQRAWDVPVKDLIEVYSIIQKFTDQAISADLYRKIGEGEMVGTDEMIRDYLYMVKLGLKTRYYQNTLTADEEKQTQLNNLAETFKLHSEMMESSEELFEEGIDGGCDGGVCTL